MKIVHIKTETAVFFKRTLIDQMSCSYRAAVDRLKHLVHVDYTLVRAMQDKSLPIVDGLRDTRELRIEIAENISAIDIIRKRYETVIKYLEHPVRARVEAISAKEFDQIYLRDQDSILSSIEDAHVGDAVDFILHDADAMCIRLCRLYLDDNRRWVSLDNAPYVTGWKAWIADPVNRFNLFTDLEH